MPDRVRLPGRHDSRSADLFVGGGGGGLRGGVGEEIQDDLDPPVGLVANLDWDAAEVAPGADKYGKVDALSGGLIHGDEIRLEKILVGPVGERFALRGVHFYFQFG